MENFFLQAVAMHLGACLPGSIVGRIWQSTESSLAIDFRRSDGRFLFVSADPAAPSLYLTARQFGELERAGASERSFAALLRKRLRAAALTRVDKPPEDRVVTFTFESYAPDGSLDTLRLVVELTGRSSNAYLVDAASTVLGVLRARPDRDDTDRVYRTPTPDPRPLLETLEAAALHGLGPTVGDVARSLAGFGPTLRAELAARAEHDGLASAVRSLAADLREISTEARLYTSRSESGTTLTLATFRLRALEGQPVERFDDPSAAADARESRIDATRELERERRSMLGRIRAAIAASDRLARALASDFAATEGAERLREIAESLLAQATTARMTDGGIEIVDLYSEDEATILVEADRGDTAPAIAERLFARHRKANRTREAVAKRTVELAASQIALRDLERRAVDAADTSDLDAITRSLNERLGLRRVSRGASSKRERRALGSAGTRRFVSSDGLEVLVGRSSAANDALTFKIARPSDLWLHAADYPGSHVVVRNPGRGEVPRRTIEEAARLAAYYSDARGEALADVRFTQRKFVSKPRGAAPGLVRLAQFKTIAVRPSSDLDRAL